MNPSCCFFGDLLPLFSTEREKDTFEFALIYQIDKLIREGIFTFNSCMLPGIDLIYSTYIAGMINRYKVLENKDGVKSLEYKNLRLHIYKKPFLTRTTRCLPEDMQSILQAASFVHRWSSSYAKHFDPADQAAHCLFI